MPQLQVINENLVLTIILVVARVMTYDYVSLILNVTFKCSCQSLLHVRPEKKKGSFWRC